MVTLIKTAMPMTMASFNSPMAMLAMAAIKRMYMRGLKNCWSKIRSGDFVFSSLKTFGL